MIVITGFQRSGTTALGEILATSGTVSYFSEVFHPEGYSERDRARALRLRPEANVFRFFDHELPLDLRGGPPSASVLSRRWMLYVDYLYSLEKGRRPVIDIKYNSWRNLAHAWESPTDSPNLMAMVCAQQPVIIVHVVRRSMFRQALSELLAHQSGIFHLMVDQPAEMTPVVLEPRRVLDRMRASRDQHSIVSHWLKDRPHIELTYEELFEVNGMLSPAAKVRLSEAIGFEVLQNHTPVLRRVVQRLGERVLNLDEITRYVQESEFGSMNMDDPG